MTFDAKIWNIHVLVNLIQRYNTIVPSETHMEHKVTYHFIINSVDHLNRQKGEYDQLDRWGKRIWQTSILIHDKNSWHTKNKRKTLIPIKSNYKKNNRKPGELWETFLLKLRRDKAICYD